MPLMYPNRIHDASTIVSDLMARNFIQNGNNEGMDYNENRIKQLRDERGWSQEYLGEKIGIGRSAISKLEKGDMELNTFYLKKLAKAFDCNSDDIWHYRIKPSAGKDSSGRIDADFLLECWGAILKAAKARQRELTRAEEIVYPIMLYNHLMECRSDGMEAAPSEATASLIMKQKVA